MAGLGGLSSEDDMDSILQRLRAVKGAHPEQRELPLHGRTVAGLAERQSCDPGDGQTARPPGRLEGRQLPPALEPSSNPLNDTRPLSDVAVAQLEALRNRFQNAGADADLEHAGALTPGLPATPPKAGAPIVHTFPGKTRSDVGPQGQRALDLSGVQVGLDGRSYAPGPEPPPSLEDWWDRAPPPWVQGEEQPEPAPPAWLTNPQLVFGPLEPWLHREPVLPLFGHSAVKWDRSRGEGEDGYEVNFTQAEWREAAAESLAHAAACLRAFPEMHPWKEKKRKKKPTKSLKSKEPLGLRLIEYVERNAREVLDCDRMWRIPVAECGAEDNGHSIMIDGCDSKCCSVCGNDHSGAVREAARFYAGGHPIVRAHKGKKHRHGISRDRYTHTITIQKPPTFTPLQLRQEVEQLGALAFRSWKGVFRYLPRKKDGTPGEYPGICAEAGMFRGIHFGPHMNPHAHLNRYGAHHWSEDLRDAVGGGWTFDGAVRDKQGRATPEAMDKAFAISVEYAFPMSNKPGKHRYMHPWYAALITVATFYQHLTQGYGSMKGILRQVAEAKLEARGGVVPQTKEVEHDILSRLNLEPCPHCGSQNPGHWRWHNVKRDRGLGAFMRARMERAQAARPPPPGGPGP